jgi:hypothetical protein
VRDAAEAVLATGADVVLEEHRPPNEHQLELYAPLLNVLRHRRKPCVAVVLAEDEGALRFVPDAIALTAAGSAASDWNEDADPARWLSAAHELVSPEIPAGAVPEQVQALVRALRSSPTITRELV